MHVLYSMCGVCVHEVLACVMLFMCIACRYICICIYVHGCSIRCMYMFSILYAVCIYMKFVYICGVYTMCIVRGYYGVCDVCVHVSVYVVCLCAQCVCEI